MPASSQRTAFGQTVAAVASMPVSDAKVSGGVEISGHEMRLATGDLAGAIEKFQIAHANGPHFADPLKDWGDALARQRKWIDALAKYDQALKLAPAWPELRQAREAAQRRVA